MIVKPTLSIFLSRGEFKQWTRGIHFLFELFPVEGYLTPGLVTNNNRDAQSIIYYSKPNRCGAQITVWVIIFNDGNRAATPLRNIYGGATITKLLFKKSKLKF